MKRAMLITVGVGTTVSHGIAFAIRQANPNFVLFLTTVESEKKTLPEVFSQVSLSEDAIESRLTSDENDVQRCAIEYARVIREVAEKGYRPEEIVADFTSGTKAMSAGLVAAGLEEDIATISYIHGERGEGGRVMSGSEVAKLLHPLRLRVERSLRRAVDLFNTYRYETCLEVLDHISEQTALPEIQARVSTLRKAAEAYRAWDRFEYSRALEELKDVTEAFLRAHGIKGRVEGQKQILHRLKSEQYVPERAVDLWNSAERRAAEGRFDDAVARLYRLLEYIAQVRLHLEWNQKTGNLNLSDLPNNLREKYRQYTGPSGRVKLGLVATYDLLRDLGDPLGSQFMADHEPAGNLKKVLGLRNNSILAHGFGPVGREGYEQTAVLVRAYLDIAFKGWEELAKRAEFPFLNARKV